MRLQNSLIYNEVGKGKEIFKYFHDISSWLFKAESVSAIWLNFEIFWFAKKKKKKNLNFGNNIKSAFLFKKYSWMKLRSKVCSHW